MVKINKPNEDEWVEKLKTGNYTIGRAPSAKGEDVCIYYLKRKKRSG